MFLLLTWLFGAILIAAAGERVILNANILVMYSSDGELAFISDTFTVAKRWQQHLAERLRNDVTWPFNATVELFDVHSSFTVTTNYLEERMNDKNLPPVTALIGAEVCCTFI
jgi:ABC-type arginine transport system ATPase subunit